MYLGSSFGRIAICDGGNTEGSYLRIGSYHYILALHLLQEHRWKGANTVLVQVTSVLKSVGIFDFEMFP